MNILAGILYFFYPPCCTICGRLLRQYEEILCSHCFIDLPRTNYHKDENNPVAQVFWGRVKVDYATAYFFFNKGSIYQPLFHRLKYSGHGEIGIFLGKAFASELKGSVFEAADIIIPVPLHPKKQKKRGYNQSVKIGLGMSKILDIPLGPGILVRNTFTRSQTQKSRYDRYLNMQGVFEVVNKHAIQDKKVLLIDDVVTTGSTLEACAAVLLEAGVAGVMVGAVGVA